MTGDVVHIWGVVGESEMSSQRLAEIQFLDISEMFIDFSDERCVWFGLHIVGHKYCM